MDKETAKRLMALRLSQEALSSYAEYREGVIKDALVRASVDDLKALQGQYLEVRKLRTLSDEIIKALG